MQNHSVFFDSLSEHRRFIRILVDLTGDDGTIHTSIKELAGLFGKSPSAVQQYIKRINKIDTCIETKNGVPYRLNYNDLAKNGIFKLIFDCMKIVGENTEKYASMNHFQKMEFLGVSREIIYMIDAYLLTYINKSSNAG